MPTQVQFRRGTTAQNDVFVGAEGEISIDTDRDTIRVHDGSTAGGFEIANLSATQTLSNKSIGSDLLPSADSAYDLGSPSLKWKDLHLSGSTIYLGDLVLKDNNGTLSIEDSAGVALAGSFSTLNTTGNVVVGGNLTVNGTTTTINSTELAVDDLNITVASGAADSASANGAGITVDGANATVKYTSATDTWDLNKSLGTTTNVISNYTTTELSEGDNLYYTTVRVDSDIDAAFVTKSTGDLSEGDNLYYTTVRVDSDIDAAFVAKSTGDLSEGSNLYYTTARADSDARHAISASGDLSYDPNTGVMQFDVESVYTKANFDSDLGLALDTDAVTTTDLTEGDNLYYTTARADSDAKNSLVAGTGITYTAATGTITSNDSEIVHDNLSGFVANEHIDHSGVTIAAGSGLTGGGTIETTRTLNIGEGTGITVSADAISTNDAEIVHDDLSGFVGNEHIDHSGVVITSGAGLTGGGDITTSRTLAIGAGTGITVNADDVAISNTAVTPGTYASSSEVAQVTVNQQGQITGATDVAIDHDALTNFVADEHVAHSGVSVTAGSGLTGGGDITTTRTINIGEGTGITVSADAIATNDAEIVHDDLSGFVANEHIDHTTVSVTAGNGLTGGGTIAATRTINIGEGTGITVSADAIATNDAEIVHDNLSGFVSDEHIAHSGVTLTAGNGLTGGGTIAASRTFAVGAGTGVTVNANDVAIGQDVATTADVTFNSLTTTDGLIVGGDLQVTGTTTTVNSASLEVTDNMIYMNAGESDGSPTQSIDVGWAANVNDGGSYTHVGMFRDATDDRFKVFGAYTPEPDAAVEINTGHASFALADFQADTFYGALSGNATTATTLQTARTIGGISFNGSSNINLPGVNTTGNQDTSGNAATATALATGRTIGLSGDVTATGVSFDGTGNITLTTAMAANSVDLTTHTTGNYVATIATGTGLDGSSSSEGGTPTITLDLSELPTSTTNGDGDYFIVTDTSNVQRKLTKGNIAISGFSNDAGYTTNVGDITGVTAGSGLTGGGASGSVTLSHADTSSQASVNNSGRTYIQDITLDTYGHITAITSATETVVDTDTTYTAGTALDLSGTTFNVDLSELSTSTTNGDGDYFVVTDTSNAQRKLTKGNINISGFNNDAGYTTNVGDITGVTAGTGLTGGGSSGSVTLNVSGITSSMMSSPNSLSILNSAGTVLKTIRGPGS